VIRCIPDDVVHLMPQDGKPKRKQQLEDFSMVRTSCLCVMLMHMSVSSAQIPHIVGAWKLNVEASDPQDHPPRVSVREYRPIGDGFLLGLVVTIDAEGYPSYLQFTAKTDGLDYPEYNPNSLAALTASGAATSSSYSETQLDEYTVEWVDSYEGEPVGWGTRQVSVDGQRMTLVANARNREGEVVTTTMIFDRQE
jgi:hypothetical protein